MAASQYSIADFSTIEPVPCPCGAARRAFADNPAFPGTLHVTEISENAKLHYHKAHTETYFILECAEDALMELGDEQVSLKPGIAIVIPPGLRHRAVGQMKVLIVCVPDFDAADEWFD